ncbi:hypothetical protein JTE90_027538 [Oedothorax gibbosus]|uniref:Peptidase M20 dimerisation domain-containing protein n=1 Tax=Oedothorax gibbosus TaxID=931172 RepID=A0AAV6VLM9_9ARAC|nr:hypothetical protein JTE90_027538 [Oedothorax gibbosus]
MPKIVRMFCKISLLLTIFVVILVSIAVLRALFLSKESVPETCTSEDNDYISDSRGLSKRLSEALKFETVSYAKHKYNEKALAEYLNFLNQSFPLVHSSQLVTREIVNNFSVLYHVQGSNEKLKPYLLAGHMDVVPVEEQHWEFPPFGGQIKDGFIYGRGTIDCKHIVMGVLEAVEYLLEKGHRPQRSFYMAFGHDEEVQGLDGAKQISKLLKLRNVKLEYILDEGSFVMENAIAGLNLPIGLISVSEKGHLDLKLEVQDQPGHSSMPRKETAIVILAKALSKLEGNVFPSMFGSGPEIAMLEEMAYCPVPFPFKVVIGNMWLFKPIIPFFLTSPAMSAIHRTTTAVTVVSGGNKVNVLPSSASASVNLRVHPAQTIQEAMDFVIKIVNDERVKVTKTVYTDPHPISPFDTFGYSQIKKSIMQIYNNTCVVPNLLIANTDTRWYLDLTKSIYRFSLVRMPLTEVHRFHGHNERIGVENYVNVVNFFLHLIKNSDTEIPSKHFHEEL